MRMEKLLEFMPFLMTVDGRHKVNPTRIIEAIIISLISGAFAGYIALQKMEVKFEGLQTTVSEIKQDVRDIRRDFYKPGR